MSFAEFGTNHLLSEYRSNRIGAVYNTHPVPSAIPDTRPNAIPFRTHRLTTYSHTDCRLLIVTSFLCQTNNIYNSNDDNDHDSL